jgi:hypothetical protein
MKLEGPVNPSERKGEEMGPFIPERNGKDEEGVVRKRKDGISIALGLEHG